MNRVKLCVSVFSTTMPLIVMISPAASQTNAAASTPLNQNAELAGGSSDPQSPSVDQGFTDIVVTAQRVSQRLQDVPASITAVTGRGLSEGGVRNITEITSQVPNLTVTRNLGIPNLYIRGIGNSFLSLGGDASVAFHQDGVYIGRPRAQVTAFLDVDRVEVLRGPQGTLYGRNATGGAINIITVQPSDVFKANGRFSAGNYGLVHFDGGVGGPLAPGISVRAAATATRRQGFGENIVTGGDIDNLQELGGRLSLRVEPSENFDYLVSADYYHAKDKAFPFHLIGAARSDIPLLGIRLGGATAPDIRDIASEGDPMRKLNVYGFAGTGTWQIGNLSLKSITSYRHSRSKLMSDSDGTTLRLVRIDQDEKASQFSQEITGTYQSGPVTVIGGASYFDEKLAGATLLRLFFVGPNVFGGTGPAKGSNKAYAVYGQAAYAVTDQLTLTGALRYSDETRRSSGSSAGVQLPPRKVGWSSFTPKAMAEYKITSDVMVYVSASKGFKSGTLLIGNPQPPVNPETLWAYEAGLKSQFLDRRIQLNAAAFLYNYKDLQVSRTLNNTTITENAASARIKGIEVELNVLPWEGGRISTSATYLDTKFRAFNSVDAVRPLLGPLNLTGNRLPIAPKITTSVRLEQAAPLANDAELRFNLDFNYRSRIYFDAFNVPNRSQSGYTSVDGRIGYEPSSGIWTAGLWGRNLTNKTVVTSVAIGAPGAGYPIVGSLNEPRTYGVDLTFKF